MSSFQDIYDLSGAAGATVKLIEFYGIRSYSMEKNDTTYRFVRHPYTLILDEHGEVILTGHHGKIEVEGDSDPVINLFQYVTEFLRLVENA